MSKIIRIGVIGCGGRIRGLLNRLFRITDQVKITALCDPAPDQIATYREHFKSADATVYSDYRELVKARDVDWVVIGSWNCFHAEHAIAALNAGKDVFCEKPLATTLEDCLAIRDAWKKSGRLFSMGFTLRYSPHYRRIKELITKGCIGKIISMEFNETLSFNHGGYIMGDWRRLTKNAGSHLLEKCSHDIDLANWISDSVASRVAGFGGLNFFLPENAGAIERIGNDKNGSAAYSTWPQREPHNPFTCDKDIYDNQVSIIEYANHTRATFHANCNAGIPERRMYICGSEGSIRADVITGRIELQRIGFDSKIEDHSTEAKGGHGDGDVHLISSLFSSMLEGTPPFTGLEDGLKAAATCFAIDEATSSGKVVTMQYPS